MDIGTKNKWLNMMMYNDNEIGKIYRDNDEYAIEINMWNGEIRLRLSDNKQRRRQKSSLFCLVRACIFFDKTRQNSELCTKNKLENLDYT